MTYVSNNSKVVFDLDGLYRSLNKLKDQTESDPNFWHDPKNSSTVLKKIKNIELNIKNIQDLKSLNTDLSELLEIVAEDQTFLAEAESVINSCFELLKKLEIFSFLSDELDDKCAYLSIQPGAGGTESHDWAAMILRMYQRFCQKMAWQFEILSLSTHQGIGVKNVECQITGDNVYGYLKAEHGIHRLIRISPFDSNKKRHTSFVSVAITPVIDDDITIKILDKDIRIDTYRASGAGGQHVNKTDSAVRISHIPSGIVVQSQSQRSQHQNKQKCLELLKAKLYSWEKNKKKLENSSHLQAKSSISFGSQIRTYTLHPFCLVKDHRSSYENSNAQGVLAGDLLLDFIKSYLQINKN